MLEETTPRTSAAWKPHTTFAAEMGLKDGHMSPEIIQNVDEKSSAV
jgi:hypothetical protein